MSVKNDHFGGENPKKKPRRGAREARATRADFLPSRDDNLVLEGTARRGSKTQNFQEQTMQSLARDSRDLKTIFQKVENNMKKYQNHVQNHSFGCFFHFRSCRSLQRNVGPA
jgi:ATP-dependent protease HslVU (ClpYQ) peptidase subunit